MFLALREMRRAVVRYALLVVAIGLLVFLILFQQALQDGLITSFVGAVRNQSAPVLVFSVDGQRSLQGSALPPPLEEQVRSVDQIGRVAVVGQSTFTVTVGDDDESDASLIGTDDLDFVAPGELSDGRRPEQAGEAIGSHVDFAVGDTVTIVPVPGAEPVTIEVVGLARDIQLSVTPTLFADLETFEAASQATNPDTAGVLPSVLAVAPIDGVADDELVTAIDAAAPDAEALTRDDAASQSPGVAQVQQSFRLIFLLYALVVPLVTGLFFLIITLQKARALTLLRAMGAQGGVLARSLLLQVTAVLVAGVAFGVAAYFPLSRAEIGGLALRFDTTAVVVWAVLLTVLGLVSAAVSLRRVLAIDPIEATTGGGVQ